MKHILLITPYVPYPLNSGGNQAFYNMVDYLRTRMSVSILLYPRHAGEKRHADTLKQLWPDVTFHLYQPKPEEPDRFVRHPLYLKWLLKAQASIGRKIRRQRKKTRLNPQTEEMDLVRAKSTLPNSLFGGIESSYADYVARVSRQGFDIVQVEFYELISLVYVLPEDVQTVFVHHEPRFVHNANEMQLFREVTPMDRLQFGVARDYERSALSHYKHLIALTEVDRQVLTDFLGHGEHIHVSPAMVKRPEQPGSFQPAVHHRLTFVGSEDHCPNLDAVNWFCHDIIPLLREKGFRFTLQVIGNWRSQYVHDLCKACPELELTGFVDDLHTFLQGSIALVPIRIGAGMRMKIMDAVSAGVPFVTTSKGVEGLDFRDGEECLIADTATGFAEAVVRLSDDPALQECLSKQADGRLRQLYDPDQVLATRLSIYNTL